MDRVNKFAIIRLVLSGLVLAFPAAAAPSFGEMGLLSLFALPVLAPVFLVYAIAGLAGILGKVFLRKGTRWREVIRRFIIAGLAGGTLMFLLSGVR